MECKWFALHACQKGFLDYFKSADADIFCIQETKLQEGQIQLDELDGYNQYWNYAEKMGYSGVAMFTKMNPYQFHTEWELKNMILKADLLPQNFLTFIS